MLLNSLYKADPGVNSLSSYFTPIVPHSVDSSSRPAGVRFGLILLPRHTAPNRFPVEFAKTIIPSWPLGGIAQYLADKWRKNDGKLLTSLLISLELTIYAEFPLIWCWSCPYVCISTGGCLWFDYNAFLMIFLKLKCFTNFLLSKLIHLVSSSDSTKHRLQRIIYSNST